LDTTPCLGHW